MDSATNAQTALIFGAILLHGVCYDFLFIAGQLYVDGESTERNRGAAQGFIAFILGGVGAFVGPMESLRVPFPDTQAGFTPHCLADGRLYNHIGVLRTRFPLRLWPHRD